MTPPPPGGGGHWVIKMWQSITSSHTHWHTHTTHWQTHTTHTNTHTQTTQAGRSIPCGHTHPHKHTDTDTHTYTHTTQAGRSTHCGQVLPAFSNFQLRKQVELIEKAGRTYHRLTQEELWRCCSFGCQRGTELVFQNAPYIGAKLGQSPGIPNSPGIPHKSGIPHFRRNNYVYYLQTCNYR